MLVNLLIGFSVVFCFRILSVFFEKKFSIILAINFLILYALYFGLSKTMCLELLTVVNIYSIVIHNYKLKSYTLLYICLVSVGLFLRAVFDVHRNFLLNVFSDGIFNLSVNNEYILMYELCYLVGLLMIIGFIPFSERVMYLFSISNELFKTTIFIIPMTIMLFIFRDLLSVFSASSLKIVGIIICVYSGMYFVLSNNLKSIFMYIITYFYGLQISLLAQTESMKFINLWFVIVSLMIVLLRMYMPNRTYKYSVGDIRNILLIDNRYYLPILTVAMFTFVLTFVNNLLVFNKNNIIACVVSFLPLFCFFGKFSFFLIKKNKNSTNTTNTFDIRTVCLFLMILFLFIISIYNIMDSRSSFYFLPLSFSTTCLLVFCCSLVIFFVFAKLSLPKIFSARLYLNIFFGILHMIKIIYLIVKTSLVDFFLSIYEKISMLFQEIGIRRMSNILHIDNVYFYMFFLLFVIIVLLIECIIL